MKNVSVYSFCLTIVFFSLFTLTGNDAFAGKIEKKKVWTFTNSTGQAANDLHMELQAGCKPTNIVTDAAGISRVGGIFTDYPNAGSPTHHDYKGGTVADGSSITLQFDTETKPKKWWWTKDGNRIGDIEYADSDDLAYVPKPSSLPEQLDYTVTGTGRTTGHIANLTVFNPTPKPFTVIIPVCVIPSDGRYQSYVVIIEIRFTVGINETVVVPIHGYCANIYKPAVPAGAEMPPVSDWIFEDENYLNTVSMADISGNTLPSQDPGNIQVTVPGTNTLITAPINEFENPELFGQITIAAVKNIKKSYDSSKSKLNTPYSNQPELQEEAVIQHTTWIFTSNLTGNAYKLKDLKNNFINDYESNSGEKFANANPEIKLEAEQGLQNLWNSFEVIGQDAKILVVTQAKDVDPDDVDDPSDLPTHIRNMYNRYAFERDTGKNHDQALRTAVRAPGLRERWGNTFRRLYGR